MQPQEMQALLRKRPFEPFRLHLADGRVFDIKDPRINLVTELRFVLGIPELGNPDSGIADHFVRVDWSEIVKVEPLTSPAPT